MPRPVALRELTDWLAANESFAAVLAGLAQGESGTVDGAWNSSASLVAATLAQRCPGTLLIAIAHPRDLDPWFTEQQVP